MANGLASMFQIGEAGYAAGTEQRKARTLKDHFQQATSGDQAALSQVYGVSPEAGMKAQQFSGQQRESAAEQFSQLSRVYSTTRDPHVAKQWAQAGVAAGMLPPEAAQKDFANPADLEGSASAAAKFAEAFGGGKGQEQYTLSPGAARYDARGNLIAERPFAPVKPSYQWTDQGLVAVQGTGAQPVEYGAPAQGGPSQGGDPFGFLASAGATVTSGQRSPEKNAKVGGVANSYHLTGQARDILPPQNPQQAEFIRQQAAANGLEVIDEGDHWHLEPTGRQQAQGGGNRVMPAPKGGDKPSALQERLQIAREMGATDDELRQIAIGREGAAAGAKPLPVAALRIVKDETDAANTATQINSTIDRHLQNIDSGKLEFGMVSNLLNQGKLAAGMGDEEARNFQEFKSDLEKLRNDSLRLNNGVQTDGDAQRAWNELVANLNDAGYVRQRLQTIRQLNERAARLRRENVEMVLSNYGRGEEQPAAPQAPQQGTATPQSGGWAIQRVD